MMLIPLAQVTTDLRSQVGGKAWSLAAMAHAGLAVPDASVVPADQYLRYVERTGLAERISLELSRKRFEDMRWEEMWDAALRIRNIFASTPPPNEMRDELLAAIDQQFGDAATVVRSSALAEDAAGTSFAGLHESYVNVRGAEQIAEHVRLVWASLWSDAALLYRQELGLDPAGSAMAVVVQRIVAGERSGVAFSLWPEEPSQGMIEAVWGLNQGLVDGTIEPDRWMIDRDSRQVVAHTGAERTNAVMPSASGVGVSPLDEDLRESPPLSGGEVPVVHEISRRTEELFGSPQDAEWTFSGDTLHILQSRPITTGHSGNDDAPYSRSWYLSLRRSFDSLERLRAKIEEEHIPAMIADASELAEIDLAAFTDSELADEIERRGGIAAHWHEVYWEDFIPFAHGARLFGQVYNDVVRPHDPYEFIDLLSSQQMVSIERNRMLEEMAERVRQDDLFDALDVDDEPGAQLSRMLSEYEARFSEGMGPQARQRIIEVVLKIARQGRRERHSRNADDLRERFLEHFEGDEREHAQALLDLGRASYRLRDDDNIYLGNVEGQLRRAIEEAWRRRGDELADRLSAHDLSAVDAVRILREPDFVPESAPDDETPEAHPGDISGPRARERQLVGQPAGPGLVRGAARVIRDTEDLHDFEAGEVLVVDSLDPTMTFIVALASGIVERRGGMLIHGAIIAREYGLPCVTGVPEAADVIRTGDEITVDGYLGIVTINRTDT